MQQDILDDFEVPSPQESLAKERKRLWWILIPSNLIVGALFFLVTSRGYLNIRILSQMFAISLLTAVLGLLVGLLIALFPYKGLSYSQKYFRSAQWAMIGLTVLFLFTTAGVAWLAWENYNRMGHFGPVR